MRTALFFLLGIGVLCLDTLTKVIAELYLIGHKVILIPSFLSLEYYQNTGIAFSFPLTGVLLKIITCILIFGIIWYYITQEKHKKSLVLDTAYTLILAGALGNAWERLFRGFVTDMISVEHFAVFNIADSTLTLGACILLYYYFRYTS